VGKKTPLTMANFEEFLRLLPSRPNSARSWTIIRQEIEAKNYDIKAVNPNRKDTRRPEPRKNCWTSLNQKAKK
jgi:type I restriction enzyme M protein